MVSGQFLHDLYGAISHIANTDGSSCRLRTDESPQVLQLRTQAGVGSIIDQEIKFEPGMVPLQWEPVGYLVAILTLIHHDIFALDSRYVGTVMRFHRDHHVYRSSRRRDLLT